MRFRVNKTAFIVLIILGIALVVCALAVASWVMNKQARARQFHQDAKALAQDGQIDRAIIQYVNTIKYDPENVSAYIELADLYVAAGDLDNAYRYYRRASEKDPKNVDVLSKLSECYHLAGQWDDVRKTAARIISLAPGGAAQARAHHYLGQAYYVDGEYEKAAEQFRMVTQYDSSNLDAVLALALVETQHLRRTEASARTVAQLTDIAADETADAARRAEAAVRAAKFYAGTGDPEKALEYYRGAIELQGESPRYWLALADFYKSRGPEAQSLSQAEKAYRKALEVGPSDPDAILSLGLFYKDTGRNDRVVEIFQRGIAAEQARAYHQLFYQHLIEALLAQSDIDGAWRRLADLRAMKNADDVADYLEGRIRLVQADGVDENLLRAERLFTRVTRIKPRFPLAYYYLGLCLAARGMLDDAKVEFQRAQALVSEFPEASIALAETYMRTREFDKAAIEARSVLDLDPRNFRANLIVGRALLAQGNPEGALNFLEQARAIQPASPEPYIALSDLHAEGGDWEKAFAVLEDAARVTDDPDRVKVAGALLEYRRGNASEAVEIAHSLTLADPADPGAAAFYVSMLYRAGRADDALDFLTSRLEKHPDVPGFHTLQGDLLRSLGRNEEALAAYSASLALAPADRDALAGAVEALVNLARYDEAREKIRLLDEVNPGSPAGHLLEARILEQEGKLDAAAALLENSLRQNSSNPEAHYRLAMLHKARGETDRAIESLKTSLKYNPSSVSARLELAELYYRTRYFDDALREADLASRAADDPRLLGRAAAIAAGSLLENQRVDEAISEWTRLPSEVTDSADYALKLAHLYLLNGQLDDAEKSFRKAAGMMAEPAPALEGIARVLLARGRNAEALEQARAAMESGADDATRLRLLQIIAAVNVREGNRFAALDALERMLEAAGGDPALLIQAGDAYMALDELEKALAAYGSAADAGAAAGARRLAAALQKAGRFDEAERVADDFLKDDPGDFEVLVLKGRALLGKQKYREAAAVLERAVASSEAPPRELAAARFYLAEANYRSGLLPAAETQLRRALAQEPDFTRARLLLAEVLLQNGSFEQAATAAREVVESEPENARAWAIKADALKLSGNAPAAVADYRKALELERNTATLLALMDALARLGREEEADRVLESYVDEDPTDAATAWMLGRVWEHRGRLSEAEAILERALEANESDNRLRTLLADVYRKQGKFDDAERLLRDALPVNPSPEIYRALGALYSIKGDDTAAEETFRKGIAAFPDNLDMYVDLADLVSSGEEFSRGVAVLEKGIEANPDAEPFYEALASFYIRLSRSEEAERFMEETLGERPLFAALACMLGDLRYVAGRTDEALEAYEHALKYAPEDIRPRAANAVAWILTEKGRSLDRALDLASQASLMKPDDPDILDTLGWAHYRNKQYSKAVVNLARAAELSNEPRAATLYHLALAYREAGMLANAQEAARNALAADASLAGDEDIEAIMALE